MLKIIHETERAYLIPAKLIIPQGKFDVLVWVSKKNILDGCKITEWQYNHAIRWFQTYYKLKDVKIDFGLEVVSGKRVFKENQKQWLKKQLA